LLFTISGKHIDITEALRAYAEEKTSKFPKHFDDINQNDAILDCEPGGNISVEIIVRAKLNKTFVITETSEDAYKSIDLAAHKMERQLRKSKEKQRDSHKHINNQTENQ